MTTRPAPVRVGYCLTLTGPLADNSRSAQLAHEIWREDVNSRGGLLGRPVEFVRYDDQGNADLLPGIYERLIDEHWDVIQDLTSPEATVSGNPMV